MFDVIEISMLVGALAVFFAAAMGVYIWPRPVIIVTGIKFLLMLASQMRLRQLSLIVVRKNYSRSGLFFERCISMVVHTQTPFVSSGYVA